MGLFSFIFRKYEGSRVMSSVRFLLQNKRLLLSGSSTVFISAVKRLIAFKVFVYIIYVCFVYINYVYINTHTYSIYLENIYMCILII